MNFNLDTMGERELKDLRARVDRALATLDSRKLEEARKAAEEAVRQYGYSLSDVLAAKSKPGKSSGVAKYRNPADPDQTWTGRGRQPAWIKEGLASGRPMSDFAI